MITPACIRLHVNYPCLYTIAYDYPCLYTIACELPLPVYDCI